MELPSDERSAARFARIERGLGELAKGQVELTAALERAEPWRRVMRERLEFEIRRLDAVLAELRRGREGGVCYRP